jgi:hypothetical protein
VDEKINEKHLLAAESPGFLKYGSKLNPLLAEAARG